MSIMESIAMALYYPHITLFYQDIYDKVRYGSLFIFPVLLYLRYKKIINFITIKCLCTTVLLANIIVGCLYNGWSWIYLFYIFMIYLLLEAFEAEIQKEEETRQNNCQVLDGEHKKKKRKLSRTEKVSYGIFIIVAVIKVILSYLNY